MYFFGKYGGRNYVSVRFSYLRDPNNAFTVRRFSRPKVLCKTLKKYNGNDDRTRALFRKKPSRTKRTHCCSTVGLRVCTRNSGELNGLRVAHVEPYRVDKVNTVILRADYGDFGGVPVAV